MSPRPYKSQQRQAGAEQTRARIIEAARELLLAPEGLAVFSMEAVARQANVARMTVYYQFGTRAGLLEALTDALASQGGMNAMPAAFQQPDVLEALDTYIATFSRFWSADRLVTRRLRAMAALDPDFAQVIEDRNQRRRYGVRVIVSRAAEQKGYPSQEAADEVIDLLYTLIDFETFDTLAGPARSLEEVAPLIQRLARTILEQFGRSPVK